MIPNINKNVLIWIDFWNSACVSREVDMNQVEPPLNRVRQCDKFLSRLRHSTWTHTTHPPWAWWVAKWKWLDLNDFWSIDHDQRSQVINILIYLYFHLKLDWNWMTFELHMSMFWLNVMKWNMRNNKTMVSNSPMKIM